MRTKLVVLSLALPLGGMLMSGAASAEPYKGTWEQQMAARPMCGGCAARPFPMSTASSRACGKIRRTCRTAVARCSNPTTAWISRNRRRRADA